MEAVLTLRAMTRKDIAGVHRIEVLSFRSPWSKLSLMGELKNNVAHYVVAELDGELIGYCGMWVLFDEAHITNIAIAPEHRGRSYGKKMLLGAMKIAEHLGAIAMTLEVRETNTVAKICTLALGSRSRASAKGTIRIPGKEHCCSGTEIFLWLLKIMLAFMTQLGYNGKRLRGKGENV